MSSRYPAYLQDLMPGHEVYNGGVGGEFSGAVALRQGGRSVFVRVQGNTIPKDRRPVAVDLTSKDRGYSAEYPGVRLGWFPDEASPMEGTLAEVAGTLTTYATGQEESIRYSFTRDATGDSVEIAGAVQFVPDSAEEHRDAIQVIMVGRNNPQNVDDVLADVDAMVHSLPAPGARYLVLSTINAVNEGRGTGATYSRIVDGINGGLRDAYGERFLDVRQQLIDEGLERAGVEPTPADLAALRADTVPPSLRVPGDVVHLSFDDPPAIGAKSGDEVLADLVHEKIVELGWTS